jgi:hypothetical protein
MTVNDMIPDQRFILHFAFLLFQFFHVDTYRSAERAIGHASAELCCPECKMKNAK